MADVCIDCECIPYENICCCPPINGITVFQPACQVLPDGNLVNNPCYKAEERKSYWTYKLMADCAPSTRAISSIGIPICVNITAELLTVDEKIDGCDEFRTLIFDDEYEFNVSDPVLGEAPAGFKWLKIMSNDRFEKGVTVQYRLRLQGNFPVGEEEIRVKAGPNLLEFQCDDCYKVPACPEVGRLTVEKVCDEIIEDNQVELNYATHVSNPGNVNFENVQFSDRITYNPVNITIDVEDINISPENLLVDTSVPGIIDISGNLGELSPGESITVEYNIPIGNIEDAGQYIINNTARALANGVESSDTCTLNIDAVRLEGDKCCVEGTDADSRVFRLIVRNLGHSPETRVTIRDRFIIPSGVTIRFNSFDGCSAVFEGTNRPVNINSDITDSTIIITCSNLTIPQATTINKNISYRIIETTMFREPAIIENTLKEIEFLNVGEQVLLGIDNVPATARTEVIGTIECLHPC
ncbi:hypothetical protein [Natronospora cellulosivora (SeqCode)]